MLLQSWDWAVFHYWINPQVHKAHCAGELVDIHVTQSGVLEEPHCQYGGTHWLVRLFILSCRDTNNYPQAAFPPQASCNLHKPRWGHKDFFSGSCIVISQGGVAGSSPFSVGVGQSPLQAAIRDLLRWAHVLWLQLQL